MKRFLVFLCVLLFALGVGAGAEELETETETEIIIEEESNLETELVIIEEKEPVVEESEEIKTYVYEDPHVTLVILYAGSEEPAVKAIEPAREYVEFYGIDRDYFFYEISGELVDVEVEFKGDIERIC